MTQAESILKHLQGGHSLTPLEALDRFGCFRLGARVYDLKQAGYDIQSATVELPNGKHVARYWLPQSPGQLGLFGGVDIERSSDGLGHRTAGSH